MIGLQTNTPSVYAELQLVISSCLTPMYRIGILGDCCCYTSISSKPDIRSKPDIFVFTLHVHIKLTSPSSGHISSDIGEIGSHTKRKTKKVADQFRTSLLFIVFQQKATFICFYNFITEVQLSVYV